MLTPSILQTSPNPPLFRVVDSEPLRDDLMRRSEIKYLLPNADVGKLRDLLQQNGQCQVHNGPISVVRSVYFDDHRRSACQANLDGVGQRRKMRLRWYDMLHPATDFYFEIKWRDNRVTGKDRLRIQSEQPLYKLSYAAIRQSLESILPAAYLPDLIRYSEPIVVVEYCRQHFANWDGSLRMTIDYDLTFYDQVGKPFISSSFPRNLDRTVVLEGKVPVGRESELREFLFPYKPRLGRCSKYIEGCRLLGHLPYE